MCPGGRCPRLAWGSLGGSNSKDLPATWETWILSLGWEDHLEKGMAAHSSILAWRIPWTEEPGRLSSMRSQSWARLSRLRCSRPARLLLRGPHGAPAGPPPSADHACLCPRSPRRPAEPLSTPDTAASALARPHAQPAPRGLH